VIRDLKSPITNRKSSEQKPQPELRLSRLTRTDGGVGRVASTFSGRRFCEKMSEMLRGETLPLGVFGTPLFGLPIASSVSRVAFCVKGGWS
jgi:hypothetical protein